MLLVAITTVSKSYSHYLYRQTIFIIASITSDSTYSKAQLNTYTCSHVHPQKLFPLQKCHYLKVVVNEKLSRPLITTSKVCSTPMLHVATHTMKAVQIQLHAFLTLGVGSSLNYIMLYCHNIEVRHSANYKPMYAIHYNSM